MQITTEVHYVPEMREEQPRQSAVTTLYHSLRDPPVLSEQDKGDIQAHASQEYIKQRLEQIKQNQDNNVPEKRIIDDEEEEEEVKQSDPVAHLLAPAGNAKALVKASATHTASYRTPQSHISNIPTPPPQREVAFPMADVESSPEPK